MFILLVICNLTNCVDVCLYLYTENKAAAKKFNVFIPKLVVLFITRSESVSIAFGK